MGKIQYMVTIEYRYNDAPNSWDNTHKTKTDTIIVCDDIKKAITEGNKILELLEKKYKLNEHYNIKERLSDEKKLITNLGYIKTPFEFYLNISKLVYRDAEKSLEDVVQSVENYKTYNNSMK